MPSSSRSFKGFTHITSEMYFFMCSVCCTWMIIHSGASQRVQRVSPMHHLSQPKTLSLRGESKEEDWPVLPEEQLRVRCRVPALQQSLGGVLLQDGADLMAPSNHCRLHRVDDALICYFPPLDFRCGMKWCVSVTIRVPCASLPFFCLHAVGACRGRQQRVALDSAWHHKHVGLQRVDVASDVLRHNLGPFRVVPTIGQKWGHDLDEWTEISGV